MEVCCPAVPEEAERDKETTRYSGDESFFRCDVSVFVEAVVLMEAEEEEVHDHGDDAAGEDA